MTTNTVTPEQRITVLKHLAGGKPADIVASLAAMTEGDVIDLARNHGYPDRDKMSWAVDVLTENLEDDQRSATERPLATGEPVEPRPTPVVRPAPAQEPATPPAARPDEFRILINAAKQSPRKRTQALADKILEDCAKLRGLLEHDTEQDRIKRKIEAEKEHARAEVARLEEQLAAAKAKLRGNTAAKTNKPRAASTAPKGDYPCRNDGCDKHYDTPQGRSMHERLKCEHRDQAAAS